MINLLSFVPESITDTSLYFSAIVQHRDEPYVLEFDASGFSLTPGSDPATPFNSRLTNGFTADPCHPHYDPTLPDTQCRNFLRLNSDNSIVMAAPGQRLSPKLRYKRLTSGFRINQRQPYTIRSPGGTTITASRRFSFVLASTDARNILLQFYPQYLNGNGVLAAPYLYGDNIRLDDEFLDDIAVQTAYTYFPAGLTAEKSYILYMRRNMLYPPDAFSADHALSSYDIAGIFPIVVPQTFPHGLVLGVLTSDRKLYAIRFKIVLERSLFPPETSLDLFPSDRTLVGHNLLHGNEIVPPHTDLSNFVFPVSSVYDLPQVDTITYLGYFTGSVAL